MSSNYMTRNMKEYFIFFIKETLMTQTTVNYYVKTANLFIKNRILHTHGKLDGIIDYSISSYFYLLLYYKEKGKKK